LSVLREFMVVIQGNEYGTM